jgi:hypothetical protein
LRAGIVQEPDFFTFAAHDVRMLWSRSVAVITMRSASAAN